MKRLMSFSILAAGLLAAGGAAAAERTVTLAVSNMTCASCPYIVREALAAVPGVSKAEVSFEDKSATVTFDDARASIAQLTAATAKSGFASRALEPQPAK